MPIPCGFVVKRLEDAFRQRRIEAVAAIVDANAQQIRRAFAAQYEHAFSVRNAEHRFRAVHQQADHGLLQLHAIAVHRRRQRQPFDAQAHLHHVERTFDDLGRFAQRIGKIEHREDRRFLPSLRAQRADDGARTHRACTDVREHLARGVDIRRAAVEPLQPRAGGRVDRRNRLGDFVHDRRGQFSIGFQPIGALHLALRVAHLRFGAAQPCVQRGKLVAQTHVFQCKPGLQRDDLDHGGLRRREHARRTPVLEIQRARQRTVAPYRHADHRAWLAAAHVVVRAPLIGRARVVQYKSVAQMSGCRENRDRQPLDRRTLCVDPRRIRRARIGSRLPAAVPQDRHHAPGRGRALHRDVEQCADARRRRDVIRDRAGNVSQRVQVDAKQRRGCTPVEHRRHVGAARVGRRFPGTACSDGAAGIVEFVVHSSISCLRLSASCRLQLTFHVVSTPQTNGSSSSQK